MSNFGFVPCFKNYIHSKYPIDLVYSDKPNIQKVKKLLSAFFDTLKVLNLKNQIGNVDIQAIRPNSRESKKIIGECKTDLQLYRIDYGNTPFRIVFGLERNPDTVYFFILDTKHTTFSGKHRSKVKN